MAKRKKSSFKKELEVLEIGWQRRPERRWVANLLANEQAVRPLLKYIMTTEVESQEREMERAAGWDQRVDQEEKELLDSM